MVGFLALFNIPDGFDDESNGFASSGRLGYRALGAGSYSGGHVSALFPAACWGASEPFYGPGGVLWASSFRFICCERAPYVCRGLSTFWVVAVVVIVEVGVLLGEDGGISGGDGGCGRSAWWGWRY